MPIDQTNVIDAIGIDNATGDVVLTITDHLEWVEGDQEHLLLLQEKINTYLSFIESGEILEKYPDARNKNVLMEVVHKYPLSQEAQGFCNKATNIIEDAGMKLRKRLFDAS